MDKYYKGDPINGAFTITEGKDRLTKAFISVVSKPDNVEVARFAYPALAGYDTLVFNASTGQLLFKVTPAQLSAFINGYQLFVEVKLFDLTGSLTTEFEGGLVFDSKTDTYGRV